MKQQDSRIAASQYPWVDTSRLKRVCSDAGISVTEGPRHNQTDGECHYILSSQGHRHELNASRWDFRLPAWQKAIQWISAHENARHTD